MCDQICDVITCCVWNYDMCKINVYDEIMIKNLKKGENMYMKEIFYINIHLKDRLQMEFTAC